MVFPPKDYMVALVYEDNDRVITWTDGKGNTYIKCRNKPRNSMLYGISFIEVGK